jgi:hypothetical protein
MACSDRSEGLKPSAPINCASFKFGDECTLWANDSRNSYQKQLDHWWQAQRDLAFEEADMYFVGGFQEFHSKTPSFHKGRRDRDWRVR